jgi:hypothetical protein
MNELSDLSVILIIALAFACGALMGAALVSARKRT